MMPGHPRTRTLCRYADATLSDRARARVTRHLTRCARCRAIVQDVRSIDAAARGLPDPELPADAFDRIVARRAAGERVLLPADDTAGPVRGRQGMIRIVAALLAVVVVGVVAIARAPVLNAQASELRIDPEHPTAAARIEVEYVGSAALDDADRLTLRARLRTPRDEAYNRDERPRAIASLLRGGDGVYRGEFTLPDDVVYAVLVVENAERSVVDHNARRGWELLVHDASGRPLADALIQRANDMMGRDWEEAHASARRLAELYPERPSTWNMLAFYEWQILGSVDSLRARHQARLDAFHLRFAGERLTGDEAADLMWYARSVDDTVRESFWRARLIAEHPTHPMAVQERVNDISGSVRSGDPLHGALARLEQLWQEVGPVHMNLPLVGGVIAQSLGDSAEIVKWADRFARVRRGSDGAYTMLSFPALRPEAMRRLRARLDRLAAMPDSARGLFETREEFQRRTAEEMRGVYALLGQALIDEGQRAGGLDTLALAIRDGWDADLFDEVAAARLGAGDTSGALALWAKVAVDPTTDPSYVDSVQTWLGRPPEAAGWSVLLADARVEMRERVLAEAVRRPFGRAVRLETGDGRTIELDDVTDAPTVVVFWSRYCGPALEALPRIMETADDVERLGGRLVLIVDEPRSDELHAFMQERAPGLTLYHDRWRDATRAFQSFGTPWYFVVAEGRIRFENSEPGEVVRQVSVLASPAA